MSALPAFTVPQAERGAHTLGSKLAFQYDLLPLGLVDRILYLGASGTSGSAETLDARRQRVADELGHRYDIRLVRLDAAIAQIRERNAAIFAGGDARAAEIDREEAQALASLDAFLAVAIRHESSDLHVELLPEYGRVRYKIDGRFAERWTQTFDRDLQRRIVYAMKRLARLDTADEIRPKRGVFPRTVDGRVYDLRVTFMPSRKRGIRGEKAIVRIHAQSARFIPLEDSGMSDPMRLRYTAIVKRPNGLDLLVGPQNSGKTNLLYSLRDLLEPERYHVMTTEAPIESDDLDDVTQVEVDLDRGVTFEEIVDKQYSADVDRLLFGEAKNRSTKLMYDMALAGSRVIGTYHGYTTLLVPERLVEEGIPRGPLVDVLSSILACRLLPRLCACRLTAAVPGEFRQRYAAVFARVPHVWRPNPEGCRSCGGGTRGYRGRVGTFELLVFDRGVRDAYHRRCALAEIEDVARASGWRAMLEDGLRHVVDGVVAISDLTRIVPHDFETTFDDEACPTSAR